MRFMKSQNEHNLKSLIDQLIKSYRWTDKLDAVDINNAWEKVVGGIFAKHTTKLYVKNRVLYVQLDSSVIRNELHMERNKIRLLINREIGKDVLDEIVLG